MRALVDSCYCFRFIGLIRGFLLTRVWNVVTFMCSSVIYTYFSKKFQRFICLTLLPLLSLMFFPCLASPCGSHSSPNFSNPTDEPVYIKGTILETTSGHTKNDIVPFVGVFYFERHDPNAGDIDLSADTSISDSSFITIFKLKSFGYTFGVIVGHRVDPLLPVAPLVVERIYMNGLYGGSMLRVSF